MVASQWVWQHTKSVSIPAEEQNAGSVVDYFYRMEFHITPRFFSDSNYLFFLVFYEKRLYLWTFFRTLYFEVFFKKNLRESEGCVCVCAVQHYRKPGAGFFFKKIIAHFCIHFIA